MTSHEERAAGSRSITVRMSSRSRSNITPPGSRAGGHLGRVLPILRKPVERVFDLLRLQDQQILHRAARHQLGGHAGRGDGRAAAVGLKARLREAPRAHFQIEPREVAAAGVLVAAGAVGVPHQPGVPRVEEVVDQRRAIPHAAPTGIAWRIRLTASVTDATTKSTSSVVVERPSEERTAPIAQSSGTPIATSTCEGSTLPAVQAEPADTAMPLRSRARTMDSDSTLR